jgi:hypothetical protein
MAMPKVDEDSFQHFAVPLSVGSGYYAFNLFKDSIYQPAKAFGVGIIDVERNSVFKPIVFILKNVDFLRKVPMLLGVWKHNGRVIVNYSVSHFPFPPLC